VLANCTFLSFPLLLESGYIVCHYSHDTESEEISLLLSLVLHKGRMAIVKQLVESFADELSSLSIGSWSAEKMRSQPFLW
jgi:hypothetical protein